jgi:hypothetical protein
MNLVGLSQTLNDLVDLNIDPASHVMCVDESGVIFNVVEVETNAHEDSYKHTIWLKIEQF